MNKGELIKAVIQKKPYRTRAGEVEQIVNATLDTIRDALAAGNTVKLAGHGTYKMNQRDGYTGRNPKTGTSVEIPARKVVTFHPGKALKDAVNA